MAKIQLPKQDQKALNVVLDYLCDEKSDYQSQGEPQNHIYLSIQRLEKYLK